MPATVGKNNVQVAISAVKKVAPGADRKYREKPAESKGGMLPAGLRGVAQLSGFKFDVKTDGFYKGKPFVAFRGIVKRCKDGQGNDYRGSLFYHEVVFAEGRAWGNKPGKKAEAKVDEAMNNMKLLGADLSEATFEDWQDIMETLVGEDTHFHFRTWSREATKDDKNPRVNAEIVRKAEGFVDDEDELPVVEETEENEEVDTEEAGDEEAHDSTNGQPTEEQERDYVALAAVADSTDKKKAHEAEEAAGILQSAAKEAGIDFESYDSWEDVAEALVTGSTDDAESEEEASEEQEAEDEEEVVPAKGDVVNYKPLDPKTKKPMRKPVECEIVKVYGPKKKADLKNLENNKTVYKDVDWDKLIAV